jgi:hypothetical protein
MRRRRGRRGLSKLLGRLWEFFRNKQEAGAFLAIVIVSAITVAVSKLWPDAEGAITGLLGISARGLYLALLGVGFLSLFVYVGVNRDEIFRHGQGFSGLRRAPERLRVIAIETEAQLREIQEGVVAEVFGSYTPPDEEVYRIFRRNPRRSIGLYSDDLSRFVGFASIWPITEEAAVAIKKGERVEEDLTANDILPVAENATARFAVIPGIAVLPDERGTDARGAVLLPAFRRFIIAEYLPGRGRSIELIASAFSKDGLWLCGQLGMDPIGSFTHAPGKRLWLFRKGKEMPLFVKEVTAQTLRRKPRGIH